MADKQVTIHVVANVEDGEVQSLEQLIDNIKNETAVVGVDVEDGDIHAADAEIDNLSRSEQVNVEVNDSAVQEAMQNINDGINQTKEGLGELASGFGEVLTAAGSAEQNKAFLEIGFNKSGSKNAEQDAIKAQQKIQDIVAKAPGDDTAMNSILSSAVAKDVKLMDKDMQGFANSVSDYFAGAEVNGKHAAEAIQDVRSYITSGNVAELQTTGIFDEKQLDELKDIDSVGERVAKFQEMVNQSSYAGLGTADTLNNKMAEFDGMLEKSATTLGGFFTEGSKGAADLFLKFNDLTGGIAGMALVAVQQFGPGLFSMAQGLFVMIPGIQALLTSIGGVGMIIPTITGAIGSAGAALGAFITGPVGIAIAAIALLAIAIYEVGKYLGWWSDLSTMFDAISAGAQRMWDAFMNNEGVIMIIEQIKDAFNNLWSFIEQIGAAFGEALFAETPQNFDIVSAAINALGQVGNAVLPVISGAIHYFKEACAALAPVVMWVIQLMIQRFQQIYQTAVIIWPYIAAAVSGAIGVIRGIIAGAMGIWSGLQSAWRTLQSVGASVFGAINGIVSGAGGVWNSFKSTVMGAIQPIIDRINDLKNAASGVGDLLHSVGLGGIETPTVNTSYGSGGYSTVTQGNTIIFNMYGDIRDEKTLDDTIEAINSRIQFEAFASGINDNGAGIV